MSWWFGLSGVKGMFANKITPILQVVHQLKADAGVQEALGPLRIPFYPSKQGTQFFNKVVMEELVGVWMKLIHWIDIGRHSMTIEGTLEELLGYKSSYLN